MLLTLFDSGTPIHLRSNAFQTAWRSIAAQLETTTPLSWQNAVEKMLCRADS